MPENTGGEESKDKAFQVLVGVLVGVIILALAALWLTERSRRNRAANGLQGIPMEALIRGAGPATRPDAEAAPADRDIVSKVDGVPFGGTSHRLRTVTPEYGRRLGLEPGDMLLVAPAPTTAPAKP